MKKRGATAIPPFLSDDGKWAVDSKAKADMFATTFDAKNTLALQTSEIARENFTTADSTLNCFFAIRTRRCIKLLATIKEDTATGPDNIPAKILKFCAQQLGLPIAMLCRAIYWNASWPEIWRLR